MRRLMCCLAVLLLSACATMQPPLKADVASRLKQGKTAVLFNDDIGQINYIEDKYYVLGVAQVASDSAYMGIWNSAPELSEIHAEQFRSLGLNAQSAYSLLPASVIDSHKVQDAEIYTLKAADPATKGAPKPPRPGAIDPQLRDALLQKGQDSLIWLSWTGFTLHIQTLGLAPLEVLDTGVWVVDLKENRLLWQGRAAHLEKTSLGDLTGKQFLESNELQGLKRDVAARSRDLYTPEKMRNHDFGTLIGLRGAAQ